MNSIFNRAKTKHQPFRSLHIPSWFYRVFIKTMILNNVRAKDKARQGNMLIEKLLENDFLIKITYFFHMLLEREQNVK